VCARAWACPRAWRCVLVRVGPGGGGAACSCACPGPRARRIMRASCVPSVASVCMRVVHDGCSCGCSIPGGVREGMLCCGVVCAACQCVCRANVPRSQWTSRLFCTNSHHALMGCRHVCVRMCPHGGPCALRVAREKKGQRRVRVTWRCERTEAKCPVVLRIGTHQCKGTGVQGCTAATRR